MCSIPNCSILTWKRQSKWKKALGNTNYGLLIFEIVFSIVQIDWILPVAFMTYCFLLVDIYVHVHRSLQRLSPSKIKVTWDPSDLQWVNFIAICAIAETRSPICQHRLVTDGTFIISGLETSRSYNIIGHLIVLDDSGNTRYTGSPISFGHALKAFSAQDWIFCCEPQYQTVIPTGYLWVVTIDWAIIHAFVKGLFFLFVGWNESLIIAFQ